MIFLISATVLLAPFAVVGLKRDRRKPWKKAISN